MTATESFGYDQVGNRELPGNASAYQYDNNNRITAAPAFTYTFDADGSVATRSGGTTYTHDALSRLTQYNNGTATNYLYDAFGRRVKKVGATTTWFLWDGTRLLAEYDGSGNRTKRYAYLPADYVPTQLEDANGTYYVHEDHLQAPRLATNGSGVAVWKATYEAFGSTVVNQDPDGNSVSVVLNVRLPGQYYDSESGHHYNLARTYDASLARYIQADPLGLIDSPNAYVYARASATNFVDPSGLAGMYLGVSARGSLPAASGNISAGIVVSTPGDIALVGSMSITADSLAVAVGRGFEGALFVGSESQFLNADSIGIDSPWLGATAYFDSSTGNLLGLGLAGPSLGGGLTINGPNADSVGDQYRIDIDQKGFELIQAITEMIKNLLENGVVDPC